MYHNQTCITKCDKMLLTLLRYFKDVKYYRKENFGTISRYHEEDEGKNLLDFVRLCTVHKILYFPGK